jgi:dolichol-phosphate mannosyltransferase
MHDEATAVATRLHVRVGRGMRRQHNWFQLVRFACVGASGYVVNLTTFAACVHAIGIDYRVAATIAFLVAVTNNFLLNRHWTFRAHDGHAGFQAARFFTVSVLAFLFNLVALHTLVAGAGLPEVPAQAIAIVLATPLNFIGNKLWSFAA